MNLFSPSGFPKRMKNSKKTKEPHHSEIPSGMMRPFSPFLKKEILHRVQDLWFGYLYLRYILFFPGQSVELSFF